MYNTTDVMYGDETSTHYFFNGEWVEKEKVKK